MGGSGSGASAKRLTALAVVQQHNWTVGTVLLSARWQTPREIVEIRKDRVRLLTRLPQARKEFVRSFPEDVRAFMIA